MAASRVRWSDDHFREFVETAPDANVFIDARGRIVLVNAQAEDLFGYSREEMLGHPATMLIPERFHGRVPVPGTVGSDVLRDVQRRGIAIFAVRRGGLEFPAEISIRSLETDAGTIHAVAIRDTTNQVQVRERLLEHLSDLAHVTRLSTMGEMVAGLAHELNQPLYAISNYARACQELAATAGASQTALREMTAKLMAQSERAAEIVRRMRRFVARRPPRRAEIDLNSLVREVQQLMLFHSHRFAITLKLSLSENLPPVQGDSILIEQIVANLVRNAFEALSESRREDPVVVVTTERGPMETIQVTVTDNGPGITSVPAERLFEAFYTTKEQGMGLGLAISRSIAEAHGGKLTAGFSAGGGAEFRLTLPASDAAAAN